MFFGVDMSKKNKTTVKDGAKTDKKKLLISASLAANCRPTTFDEIVGQRNAVLKLKGMLVKKKIPGAILLVGDPGLGKTTLARVFARYLNCDTLEACGNCLSCKTNLDDHPDIVEVNMGVANGVADSRNLVEKARYAPRFNIRIFICDECHNLSGPAEQALLKTLEEPPPGTLFILCTTNPEKIKSAILQRCSILKLSSVKQSELVERLVWIAKKEGEDFDNSEGRKICKLIANYSNGMVREAISILEGVLYTKAAQKKAPLKDIVEEFAHTLKTSLDARTVGCMVSYLNSSIKAVCTQASNVDSCRQLTMRLRWLCMSILDDYSDNLKFKSVIYKDFLTALKKAGIEFSFKKLVPEVIDLLLILNNIEQKMNQTNIDEKSIFLGEVCKHLMDKKRTSK